VKPLNGTVTVKLKRVRENKDIPEPTYMTRGAAGMDLHADVDEPLEIAPGEVRLIPTGFMVEIPAGFEGQVRPRSGLALNYGIGVLNSPGTIDSDYRGEIKVILFNFGKKNYTVRRGDRIAQMVLCQTTRVRWEEVDELAKSPRSKDGFGHTG